jgi:lysophospholipase L1-like esterase
VHTLNRRQVLTGAALAMGAAVAPWTPPPTRRPIGVPTIVHKYGRVRALWLGDSIAAGWILPDPAQRPPALFRAILNATDVETPGRAYVIDRARGGQTLCPSAGVSLTELLPSYLAGQTVTTAIIGIGVNDLWLPGVTTAVWAAAYVRVVQRLQAHNPAIRIIPCTMGPFGHGHPSAAHLDPIRRERNGWLEGFFGAAAVANWSGALSDGAGRLAAGFDSGDLLHPNAAGSAALTAAVPLTRVV